MGKGAIELRGQSAGFQRAIRQGVAKNGLGVILSPGFLASEEVTQTKGLSALRLHLASLELRRDSGLDVVVGERVAAAAEAAAAAAEAAAAAATTEATAAAREAARGGAEAKACRR